MAIHRFQTADGKIHRVEAPTREAAEAELGRVLEIDPKARGSYARGRSQGGRHVVGWDQTFAANVPFMDEFKAGGQALIDTATGKGSLGDNWRAQRAYQEGAKASYAEQHPIAANSAKGIAFDVQAIPAFFTGGASAAPNLFRASAEKGALATTKRLAAGAGRNAVVGGSVAAGNAFAGRGSLADRTAAAGEAIPGGAAVGVAAPAAIEAPGAIGSAVGRVARATGADRFAARAANKAVVTAGRAPILDPQEQALARLGETLKADKFTPDEIRAAMAEWTRVGGPSPAFMDLVAQGGRGQRTMALIRGAAMKGGGRAVASEYGNDVAVNLQDNAIARTRALTPERRPAAEVAGQMRTDRANMANNQYREPYQTPVTVSDDVRSVLTDQPGRAALRQARADALERRDMARVQEIDALMSDTPPDTVSAATLDRAQIAMRERGDKLARNGNNARAGGARDRRAVINRDLDAVPQLAEARGAYRDASQGIEGVEKVGPRVLNAMPDELAADVARLGPNGRAGVQVGAARTLEETIGRPAEGSTGALNRIGTSTNSRRNLETTFGEQPAADYRQAINQMRDQLNNARHINPNTGSQTAGRLADETLVENIPTSKLSLLKWAVDKVRGGVSLTDAEREAIVQIATSRGSSIPTVENVFKPRLSPPEVQQPSFPNYFALPRQDQENRR